MYCRKATVDINYIVSFSVNIPLYIAAAVSDTLIIMIIQLSYCVITIKQHKKALIIHICYMRKLVHANNFFSYHNSFTIIFCIHFSPLTWIRRFVDIFVIHCNEKVMYREHPKLINQGGLCSPTIVA